MSPAQDSSAAHIAHIGMVNPPRKAKRLRELVSRECAAVSEPAVSTSELAQREQSPAEIAAGPRRRGRKPAGPMSRAAREQLRKTNHSVIEKRRREKINEALAALRELVPNEKPEGEEKEFKLEVLVRTVEYLQLMVTRVRNLENNTCGRCGGPLRAAEASSGVAEGMAGATNGKRKRPIYEDLVEDDLLSDEDLPAAFLPPTPAQTLAPPGLPSPASPLQPRLPSISSWMLESPMESPAVTPDTRTIQRPSPSHAFQLSSPSHAFQLPSPPHSVPFAPTTSIGFLPRLALPPGMQLPPSPSDLSAGGDGQASGSPWTRDDQTAASLLLNISSRRAREAPRGAMFEAQTPSSVLGMGEGQ